MYLSFFGLRSKPFQLTPDPDFLFLSQGHKKTLTYLTYGINQSQGFILVTGEVGIGKTTVIRKIMKSLPVDLRLAKVANTRVSSEQLMSLINEDFGLDATGKNKIQLLRELTDFLINQYAHSRRCMLIIDEAQNLTPDLLEEVRLLSNLETDKSKLLQIVLVGQPELTGILAKPELRQLRQRINVSCHISPLSEEETGEYIYHRLESAGNREAVVFEAGALKGIYAFSRGIPRLINITCDFILLAAFVEGTKEISAALVEEVVHDLESDNRYWNDRQTHPTVLPAQAHGAAGAPAGPDSSAGRQQADFQALNAESLERFSSLHKILDGFAGKFSDALSEIKTSQRKTRERLDALAREIEVLKKTAAEKGAGQAEVRAKKAGLWQRIFN